MSDTIRKFNRFELKYVLSLKQAEALKKDLQKYVIPDSHGKGGSYKLASLYYDTDDYKFYWEKIEGIKFRRKLRIRRYVTDEALTDDSIVYVEIKQRVDRVTQKRRVPMKYKQALELIHQEKLPETYKPEDKAVLNETLNLVKTYDLKPQVITTYDRQAFFGQETDRGLRITFDTDIKFQEKNLDLSHHNPDGHMIPAKFCILEIKANEKIPYWITELVASHGIKLIRVSKYCQALETAGIFEKSIFNIVTHI